MHISLYILDLLAIGLLLLAVTFGSGWINRLPLSYALIYLIIGVFLGPYGIKLIQLRPETEFIERLTEFVVLISLYACGLKMNRRLTIANWNSTLRLIFILMPFSIFAIAFIARSFLEISWGAAILLGAILAPTDPVLASEVQLAHPDDRDELRFALTSEGGLNDAFAFPFVYLGLYLLQDNQKSNWFQNWFLIDVLWAITAGITVGYAVTKFIIWLNKKLQRKEVEIDDALEDFIGLATILIVYSLTEIVNGYGFIAVFVAGLTVRKTSPIQEQKISQYKFTERIEKLLEVGTILLVGSLLRVEPILNYWGAILLIASLLIFIVRPLGVWVSTLEFSARKRYTDKARFLLGWFGIRGVGSLYYLSYGLGFGIPEDIAPQLAWITYATVAISVILHGVSATPLMNWYEQYLNSKSSASS